MPCPPLLETLPALPRAALRNLLMEIAATVATAAQLPGVQLGQLVCEYVCVCVSSSFWCGAQLVTFHSTARRQVC